MLARVHEAVAAGDDEGDASPAIGDDGRQLVLQATELERTVPIAGPGVVGLGGDQVAARDQLVALDGCVVVDGPLVIFEGLGGVLDTNRKTPFR